MSVPTVYEWIGGAPALQRLFERFYQRVPEDPLLGPVFAHMDPAHAQHVAAFVGEVFGGPQTYSERHGGHAAMVRKHLGRHPHLIRKHLGRALREEQRRRWIELLLDCADEVGLPSDPESRSAFVAYLEWGTRLAVINSQPGAAAVEDAPMPRWGWGEAKGPYQP
jgi:hemoglobin